MKLPQSLKLAYVNACHTWNSDKTFSLSDKVAMVSLKSFMDTLVQMALWLLTSCQTSNRNRISVAWNRKLEEATFPEKVSSNTGTESESCGFKTSLSQKKLKTL